MHENDSTRKTQEIQNNGVLSLCKLLHLKSKWLAIAVTAKIGAE